MGRRKSRQGWRFGIVAIGLAGTIASGAVAESATSDQENLLVAYALLAGSLGDEADLKYLLWLHELTLQGPAKEVERLMTAIYETSGKRAEELEKLRKLSPAVVGEPPPSPIGDAIQSAAQWAGTKEMLFPDGEFGMRFVFLQAQATRMIAVIAEEAAKFDPNPERKKWLAEVSKQYADLREQLVKAVEKCEPR